MESIRWVCVGGGDWAVKALVYSVYRGGCVPSRKRSPKLPTAFFFLVPKNKYINLTKSFYSPFVTLFFYFIFYVVYVKNSCFAESDKCSRFSWRSLNLKCWEMESFWLNLQHNVPGLLPNQEILSDLIRQLILDVVGMNLSYYQTKLEPSIFKLTGVVAILVLANVKELWRPSQVRLTPRVGQSIDVHPGATFNEFHCNSYCGLWEILLTDCHDSQE